MSERRLRSAARVVGRVAPPTGGNWGEALTVPASRALAIAEFSAVAARALGLALRAVQVRQQLWLAGSSAAVTGPRGWHRDACTTEAGHALCVLGESPTEFLLGKYPETYLQDSPRLDELEGQLEIWSPAIGEVVHYDRHTIHRRPPVVLSSTRLFLVASP